MRPILRLLGKCELTVDGVPVPFKITRKHWYVLGLVATSPTCKMGRAELAEAAWPMSDDRSRNVLLHIWRRAIVQSTTSICSGPPAHLTEQYVSVDASCIAIDYQECNLLADIALTSDDPEQVLQAGMAFESLAEDKTLLYPFPSSFVDIRRDFDNRRRAVLRRVWQAERHLDPATPTGTSVFEARLQSLGDMNAIGEPELPFKVLPELPSVSPEKTRSFITTSQIAATAIIGFILVAPIVLGSLNTPFKKKQLFMPHGTAVTNPVESLSNKLLYQLSAPRTKRSAATAICVTPKNLVIVAGNAMLTNGDHQTILVMLTKTGQSRWITKLTDVEGIRTTPKQLLSTESGRIYVASVLSAERNNARKLAPGSYLAVSVFDRDGQRIFERVHPAAINVTDVHSIQLIKDLKGGVHMFASAAGDQTSISMHVPAGNPTNTPAPLTGFPKALRITDAISDDNGHIFLLGYLPVKTRAGVRLDWHIHAMDKASKTLWSREITGAVGTASAPVRGAINALGDLVAYGPLPATAKQNGSQMLASLVTLAPRTGDVIFRDCYDVANQNPNFALCPLMIGKSAIIAVTSKAPDGSKPLSVHRFGNAETDTALTIIVRILGHRRLDGIISLYINNNGILTVLVQPSKEKASTTALAYTTMFFGRGIQTGDISATVPYGYNTRGGGLIAGHYNNAFCVYDFSKLP